MMKYIKQYVAMTLMSISLSACEKTVQIDIPEHNPKLVVNAVGNINSDSIDVFISKSVDVLKHKTGNDLSISNAIVYLKKEGMTKQELYYDQETKSYRGGVELKQGDKYEITASVTGFETVTAHTEVPIIVPIKYIQRIKDVRLDIDGNKQDEIRITFDDPIADNDYYIIVLNDAGYTFDPRNPPLDSNNQYVGFTCINTNDPSVETIYDDPIDMDVCLENSGIFFTDDLFNGKTKVLSMYVNSRALDSNVLPGGFVVYPEIELRHVSEDYYRFFKSKERSYYNEGNPFAEPSNIYTNIQNGYGVFSFISHSSYEIK